MQPKLGRLMKLRPKNRDKRINLSFSAYHAPPNNPFLRLFYSLWTWRHIGLSLVSPAYSTRRLNGAFVITGGARAF